MNESERRRMLRARMGLRNDALLRRSFERTVCTTSYHYDRGSQSLDVDAFKLYKVWPSSRSTMTGFPKPILEPLSLSRP